MAHIILFGGESKGSTSGHGAPEDLNACNAWEFMRTLNAWTAKVWVHRGSVPVDREELARFETVSLIHEFRSQYPKGDWTELNRGSTIEENWLGFQLAVRSPSICLINAEYATQPISKISHKQVIDPAELVRLLQHWLARSPARCQTMVFDGRFGHTIMLYGVDQSTAAFRYYDPWPGRSLLCRENNAAGVDATQDPAQLGGWLVNSQDLRRVLVAVVTTVDEWQAWHYQDSFEALWPVARSHFSGDPASNEVETKGTPFPEPTVESTSLRGVEDLPQIVWPGTEPVPRSSEETAVEAGLRWVSAQPYSKAAVAFAALEFGALLQSRGDTSEASHWYRQAAMLNEADAAGRLATLLRERGDHRESDYWASRADDEGEDKAQPMVQQVMSEWSSRDSFFTSYRQLPDWEVAADGPGASYLRGLALAEQGDVEGAKAAYRQAIESGQAEVSPKAANTLGILLEDQGDVQGALAAYQTAANSHHFHAAAYGWANLGRLLSEAGWVEAGQSARRRAVESGHYEVVARVGLELGSELWQQGDLPQARDMLERAAYSNDSDAGPRAAFSLGVLLQTQFHDVEGAEGLFRRAIESGHPDIGPKSAIALGELLSEQGRIESARAACKLALGSGDTEVESIARSVLQELPPETETSS